MTEVYDLRIDLSAEDAEAELVALTPEEVAELPTAAAPAQVAMHKVQKAMVLTEWGSSNLLTETFAAIDRLPEPQRTLARIEFEKAPNLVREGSTTTNVMALLIPPMSAEQRDDLLNFAASLA